MRYHLGMLVGFAVVIVYLTYNNIEKLIHFYKIRKMFGIELGFFDDEKLKTVQEKVRNSDSVQNLKLKPDVIDAITEEALAQVDGITDKSRYYEDAVYYALKDLGLKFQKNISGYANKDRFEIDFLIELPENKCLGIEAVYSKKRYLSPLTISRIVSNIDTLKKVDNFSHFVIVTNCEVRGSDIEKLNEKEPKIDVIENVITPDGIMSRIQAYLTRINSAKEGSLER